MTYGPDPTKRPGAVDVVKRFANLFCRQQQQVPLGLRLRASKGLHETKQRLLRHIAGPFMPCHSGETGQKPVGERINTVVAVLHEKFSSAWVSPAVGPEGLVKRGRHARLPQFIVMAGSLLVRAKGSLV